MPRRKIILLSLLCATLGSVLTLVAQRFIAVPDAITSEPSESTHEDAAVNVRRYTARYKFIAPILTAESVKESEKYASFKDEISSYIAKEQSAGLTSAAVYFKDFTTNQWFSINSKERYDPGSLLKVGVLMTYMLMAEKDNNLLNMEVVYHGQKGFVFPVEHFRSDTVVEGHKYKIYDLIKAMIKYSDNRATLFLEDHMDTTIFKNEFGDLGITSPRFTDPAFTLNVVEYSMMFKTLYSAGYLRKAASENALSLLAESVFSEGLKKGLPQSVIIAHKFGESGNSVSHELHESGIIYLDKKPYLLTVMTRGTDWNKLSAVIGNISKMVYDHQVTAL